MSTIRKSPIPYSRTINHDTFNNMIKVYSHITKMTFTESQQSALRRHLGRKLAMSSSVLTSYAIAELFQSCVEKLMQPKKKVRFAPEPTETFSEAEYNIIFKQPINELVGFKKTVTKTKIPNSHLASDFYIDEDRKGRREIYTKIDGKIHGTRYTIDLSGKIISDEVFDMGNMISIRTYYPSGSIKMYSYLSQSEDTFVEINYYPNGNPKAYITFKCINGLWLNEDIHKEYDATGKEITSRTLASASKL